MNDPQESPKNTSKRVLWVVLLVLVLAAAGYGVYAYIADQDNENANNSNVISNKNSNVVSNSNSVQNVNTSVNINTAVNSNSAANVNTAVNANMATNSNTNIDTSEWKTYDNEVYGYSIEYPSDWEAIEITGVVTVLSPIDHDYSIEGSAAYPVSITGYTGSISDYLNNVASDKKSSITINNQSATKVTGYQDSVSYVFANQTMSHYVVIGVNSDLVNNVNTSERTTIETMFDAMLQTFAIQ